MALSTVFHSINSPDNSPFSHSVLPVLFLPYWSFQFMEVSLTPDIILCGWLSLRLQLSNKNLAYNRWVHFPSSSPFSYSHRQSFACFLDLIIFFLSSKLENRYGYSQKKRQSWKRPSAVTWSSKMHLFTYNMQPRVWPVLNKNTMSKHSDGYIL